MLGLMGISIMQLVYYLFYGFLQVIVIHVVVWSIQLYDLS
jgi:hypothetical protein